MTDEDIQEEAGILALACGQLGVELAQGRLGTAQSVYRRLGVILKKLAVLQESGTALLGDKPVDSTVDKTAPLPN